MFPAYNTKGSWRAGVPCVLGSCSIGVAGFPVTAEPPPPHFPSWQRQTITCPSKPRAESCAAAGRPSNSAETRHNTGEGMGGCSVPCCHHTGPFTTLTGGLHHLILKRRHYKPLPMGPILKQLVPILTTDLNITHFNIILPSVGLSAQC